MCIVCVVGGRLCAWSQVERLARVGVGSGNA
jgi:hypothetical protein